MSDETKTDSHSEKCKKLDDVLDVLRAHANLLEDHTKALGGLSRAVRDIRAGIESIRSAQVAQNQMTAEILQLWSTLRCVVPPPNPDDSCPEEAYRRRMPSEEIRQLALISPKGEDG